MTRKFLPNTGEDESLSIVYAIFPAWFERLESPFSDAGQGQVGEPTRRRRQNTYQWSSHSLFTMPSVSLHGNGVSSSDLYLLNTEEENMQRRCRVIFLVLGNIGVC